MDGERFDSLIKRLGTTRLTRLAALRGLAVGAVASLTGLSLLGEESEAADRKRRKKQRICHRTSATDPGVTKRLKKKRARRHLRKHPFDTKGACTAGSTTTINIIGCRTDADCGVGRFCVGGICVQCRTAADCAAGQVCVGNVCNNPVTIINNPTTVVGLEICRQQGNICEPDEEFCCTSGPKTALCVNNPSACNPGSFVEA
jgi:hypothetical protein